MDGVVAHGRVLGGPHGENRACSRVSGGASGAYTACWPERTPTCGVSAAIGVLKGSEVAVMGDPSSPAVASGLCKAQSRSPAALAIAFTFATRLNF